MDQFRQWHFTASLSWKGIHGACVSPESNVSYSMSLLNMLNCDQQLTVIAINPNGTKSSQIIKENTPQPALGRRPLRLRWIVAQNMFFLLQVELACRWFGTGLQTIGSDSKEIYNERGAPKHLGAQWPLIPNHHVKNPDFCPQWAFSIWPCNY